jgi:hypothetical protein
MRDADRAGSISRRDFLRRATITAAAASASLIVGEAMWEALDAFGPRRLLVAGISPDRWPDGLFDAQQRVELVVGVDGGVIGASLVNYDLVGGAASLFPVAAKRWKVVTGLRA